MANTKAARKMMIEMICSQGAEYDDVLKAIQKLPEDNHLEFSSYKFIKTKCAAFNSCQKLQDEHINSPYNGKEFDLRLAELKKFGVC